MRFVYGQLCLAALVLLSLSGCQPPGSSLATASSRQSEVSAVPSISGTVGAVVGGVQTLTISFQPNELDSGGDLKLASLSLPSGWSGPVDFGCSELSSDSGCTLMLVFAPSQPASGTLVLNYSYSRTPGSTDAGSLSIPYASSSSNNVVASVSPVGAIHGVIGAAGQSVQVTFTSDDGSPLTGLQLTSNLASLPSGWSSSTDDFSCARVSTGSDCQLALSYAPTVIGSGTFALDYSYTDDAGAPQSGAINIPYASASTNDVVATPSLPGQVVVIAGGSQRLEVTFTTDDGQPATGLSVTSNLTSLPSGWSSGSTSLACARVSTGDGCQLALTYSPTIADSGSLMLGFSYVNDAGIAQTGTVDIPYAGGAAVGGTVTGLTGTLLLQDNGTDTLSILTNGSFTFPAMLSSAAAYNVTILSQPGGQSCSVSHGSGVASSNVTDVDINCTSADYALGGSISGLSGAGLVLMDNEGDTLAVPAGSTSFVFATALAYGTSYAVAVSAQPSGQTCTVFSGSGSVMAEVTTVAVSCNSNAYSVGGSVAGLDQSGLVLNDNGGDTLSVATGSSSFTFPTPLSYGSSYAVTVGAQPIGQTCAVADSAGTINGSVTSVSVSCSSNTYSLGGNITGLNQSGLVLTYNGGNALSVASAASSFAFPAQLAYGATYAVAVTAQPTGQTCGLFNGAGVVTGTVTTVTISCATNKYGIGGTIGGLTGSGLVLTDNGGNAISVNSGATSFTFPGQLPYGGSYAVAVSVQPIGQNCMVSNGSGIVASAVSNIAISCDSVYTLGGTVSGLTDSAMVLANGSATVTVSPGAGSWVFPSSFAAGSSYTVTVQTQPAGQVCRVTSGISGTLTANVSNITVACFVVWTVTIDHTKVGDSSLTDFPMLFSGIYPFLATVVYGGAVENTVTQESITAPADALFTSDPQCSSPLHWEVASYNQASGAVDIWVQIPTISNVQDTVIYLCVGNSSVTTFQGGAVGSAWDSNYAAVWHLGNGSTLGVGDSTANAMNGTNHGATATSGQFGGAASFNGDDEYITTPLKTPLEAFTVSAWFYASANVIYQRIVDKNSVSGFWVGQNSSTANSFGGGIETSSAPYGIFVTLAPEAWHYFVMTRSGTTQTIYGDGTTNTDSATVTATTTDNSAVTIGGQTTADYFGGYIEEVRVSTIARSPSWIQTEYNNQASPSTFYSVANP